MTAPADRGGSTLDESRGATQPGAPAPFGRIVRYGLSRGVTEGLLGVRTLVLAPLLGPAGMGVWALFRLSLRYAVFLGLGINRGLERSAVREAAHGDEGAARAAARTALAFNLLVFLTVGVGLLALSLRVPDPTLALGVRGVGAALLVNQLVAYGLVYLRARRSLRAYAKLEVVNAFLHLVFALGFAWWWGLAGALAGFVCADLVALALLLPLVPFRPTLEWSGVRRLLGVGFPVMLTGLTATVLATADRLVVAAMAGTVALGFYAFAASIAGLAASGAWVIRVVILPEVYARAAREGAAPAVRDHLERTVLPFARLFAPLLGLAALAIAPAVDLVVPQFGAAVPPARVFIFTGVTYGLTNLGALAVVAADRQRRLPLLSAGALVINLSISWAVLRAGGPLVAVAAGAVLSQALYAAAVLAVGAKVGGLRGGPLVLRALAPLTWCVTVVFGIGLLVPPHGLTSFALSAGIYAVALLPLYPTLWSTSRQLASGLPSRGVIRSDDRPGG